MANRIDEDTDVLLKAFITLKNEEECLNFLKDLCTVKEIQDMAQRLKVAFLLDEKMTYAEIAEQTGVSSATINRVNNSLRYGSSGYREVIDNLRNL